MKETIYGIHAVHAAVALHATSVSEVFIVNTRSDERIRKLVKLAEKAGIRVNFLDKKAFNSRFQEAQSQGVIALLKESLKAKDEKALYSLLDDLEKPPFLLILDTITSPHNLGACLRSADAAGIDAVIIPKDKSVGLTDSVAKVACGAALTMPLIQVTNLSRVMKALQQRGIWLFGAAGEAKNSLYQQDLSGPIAMVLGAEDTGLRRLTRENCDMLYKIPMQGHVSSLNVSVACGISLFEALRQRQA